MTEIEKIRSRNIGSDSQRWVSIVVAVALVFVAMASSNQMGAIANVWLSIVVFLGGYHFSDRKLHKELVQEIDTMRRELEEIKMTGK